MFKSEKPKLVIGTDEAGRGPLAGPVCAAAVALPDNFPSNILNDSKKMTEYQRNEARKIIVNKALAWAIAWSDPDEIDRLNILNASLLAMKRCCDEVESLLLSKGLHPDIVLADGNRRPPVSIPCTAVVKGDSTFDQIMAASILAKTSRDAYMLEMARIWPVYGFDRHKGYPTAFHLEKVAEHGPCPIHRKTFRGVLVR